MLCRTRYRPLRSHGTTIAEFGRLRFSVRRLIGCENYRLIRRSTILVFDLVLCVEEQQGVSVGFRALDAGIQSFLGTTGDCVACDAHLTVRLNHAKCKQSKHKACVFQTQDENSAARVSNPRMLAIQRSGEAGWFWLAHFSFFMPRNICDCRITRKYAVEVCQQTHQLLLSG